MSQLFSALHIGDVTFRNRIFVSPMCQYSSYNGMPSDWHLVHLGSRAVGGAGMVMMEATAVTPEGRISPGDLGIWSDAHTAALQRITRFVHDQGAVPGIQLAHAGRKASTGLPWHGGNPLTAAEGAWPTLAPSTVPFTPNYPPPYELSAADIAAVKEAFVAAARRALAAGFECIEIHLAHGYLLHEFLSPLSNLRTDEFGGTLENRMRFPLQVVAAVREIWPVQLPLLVRISATDWVDGGWDADQSVELSQRLRALGVDMIDCSSGGLVADASIPAGPGFQTPFAERIRREAGIATATVGLITSPIQAEHILRTGQADAVCLAREMLRDPYWPLHAAAALHTDVPWPQQYQRAKI